MASGRPIAEMPEELVRHLDGTHLAIAATVDGDGWPYTMVLNSAIAVDAHRIRFAIDGRTHSLVNLREHGRIMLEVIGDGQKKVRLSIDLDSTLKESASQDSGRPEVQPHRPAPSSEGALAELETAIGIA